MTNISLPSYLQEITPENKADPVWFSYFEQLFNYIRGNMELSLGGLLKIDYNNNSNIGSGETELVDYIFQKNQLKESGDFIEYEIFGTCAANANNKRIKVVFGSQIIFDTTSLSINNKDWTFKIKVIRITENTQKILVEGYYNDLAKILYTDGTQDLTDDIDIKLLATGVANNDINKKAFILRINPIN